MGLQSDKVRIVSPVRSDVSFEYSGEILGIRDYRGFISNSLQLWNQAGYSGAFYAFTLVGEGLTYGAAFAKVGAGHIIFRSFTGNGIQLQRGDNIPVFTVDTDGNIFQESHSYGGAAVQKKYEALVDLSVSSTIQVNVPSGVIITGVQLVVKTLITGTGAATWDATFSGGASDSIATAKAFAKNTKHDENFVEIKTTAETDISITPNAGSLDTGEIVAVVHTRSLESLDSFA